MKKIIVANRGEIASRAIWSLRSLGYETVSLYSKEDRSLPFLNNADYAYDIGSGTASKTYENLETILNIKEKLNADSIYVGYGFLYDNKDLIEKGNLIAPSYDLISLIKDKTKTKKHLIDTLSTYDINILEDTVFTSYTELQSILNKYKNSLIIKPQDGKYSKAMTLVDGDNFKESQFNAIKMEGSLQGFSANFIAEKYLKDYKEISVLVMRDSDSNITVLPEVDTSIAKAFSWRLAETPANISNSSRERILESSKDIAKKLNLIGIMNIEFFVKDEDIYFNEINTGLSVWYSLAEQVSQIDVISEQVNIFYGNNLKHNKILKPRGHAVMFKVFAENSIDNMPSFGTIDDIFTPIIPNIRTEYTAFPGWSIPVHYDNMLGKVSFWANTRQDMLKGANYILEKHMISGIETNLSYLASVLKDSNFIDGTYSVSSCKNIDNKLDKETENLFAVLASINNIENRKTNLLKKDRRAWNDVSKARWKEGL